MEYGMNAQSTAQGQRPKWSGVKQFLEVCRAGSNADIGLQKYQLLWHLGTSRMHVPDRWPSTGKPLVDDGKMVVDYGIETEHHLLCVPVR